MVESICSHHLGVVWKRHLPIHLDFETRQLMQLATNLPSAAIKANK